MVWILVVFGGYLLALVVILLLSVRPMRIPAIVSPGAIGAPQEVVSFASADGVELSGWWVPAPGSKHIVVFAHGYMMNKGELAPIAYWLWQNGIASLSFDFRAHGKSQGTRCTFGYQERKDVQAAVRFVRERIPDAKVVLIGSSMGSAAGAFAWSEDIALLDGLVLDSAYGTLSNAVLGWWNFLGGRALAAVLSPTVLLGWPVMRLNPFRVSVTDALARLKGKPILVLHGAEDDLAKPDEARRNVSALGPEAKIVWFEGCGHSEGRWEQPEKYRDQVQEFLTELGFFGGISRNDIAK